jgi:hypothetical protein
MSVFKRAVMFAVVLLACAGVYSAVRNMPIVSGCGFYGDCPDDAAKTAVPAVASMDPASDSIAP